MDGPGLGIGAFVFLFGSALAGVYAHARMPRGILTRGTTIAIGRGVMVVAVLAALLLGAMTVYGKTQFDAVHRDVRHFSSRLIELDHVLRQLGPDAAPAREMLFAYAAQTMKDIWPDADPHAGLDGARPGDLLHRLDDAVAGLRPAGAAQEELAARAHDQALELTDANWNLDQRPYSLMSPWLTAILMFWLMLTFAAFGLVAPRTRLMLATLSVGAAAMAAGMFLMVEFAGPFDGVITVSSEPLQNALFMMAAPN